jgi:hypothetical protein
MNLYFGLTKHHVVGDNYINLREIKYNSLYYLVNILLQNACFLYELNRELLLIF